MKTYIPYSLLLAAASCGLALGAETAYTTPVGYNTIHLAAGQVTLMSVNIHNPTLVAGVLTGSSATTVSDSDKDFTTLLTTGKVYVLEINNGAGEGTVQKITSWTATSLTTEDDISSVVVNDTTTYSIRLAASISSVFGANNEAGLTSSATGDPGTYDEILVVNAGGGFDTYYYYDDGTDTGWYDPSFNPGADIPLVYTDALYVRRLAGSPVDLVLSGEVKVVDTQFAIQPGNTFGGSAYPVGSTLGNSGLSAYVTPDDDGNPPYADQVLVQQPGGSYLTYYYYNDGTDTGWYDGAFNDGTDVDISNGFIIQSSTVTPKAAKIGLPYSSL